MSRPMVGDAVPEDLLSLGTIFARSFHRNNPNQERWQPDTLLTRTWWENVFAAGIQDPRAVVLVARLPDTHDIVGVLRMQRLEASEESAGMWTEFPLTDDHAKEECAIFIKLMVDAHDNHFPDRPAYLIEVFGVDQDYQGTGLGLALLQAAVERAEQAGIDVFVEANGNAAAFYAKLGFQRREEIVMPGTEYREVVMVRPRNLK